MAKKKQNGEKTNHAGSAFETGRTRRHENRSQRERGVSVSCLPAVWAYGTPGGVRSIFHKRFAHDIFIGANVKLIEAKHITMEHKVRLEKGVKIDALSSEGVVLGDGVVLGQNTVIECTGSLRALGKGVKIGSRSTFGSNCYFGAAGGITIGKDVMAGQYIRFHAENHEYGDINVPIRQQGVTHKGIVIGNNCWIGAGAVFLDGAKLGDGCVVAANAVVRGTFPDNAVIGGVPAKILRMRC